MAKNKIRDIEYKIFELMKELQKLQKENVTIKNIVLFRVQNVPIQNFTRLSHPHALQMYLISLRLNNY